MAQIDLYNIEGEVVGNYELDDSVFGIEPNEAVVYEVVKAQLANRRQGTSKTKTRSEVSGGGRKPWRQKGTGRARHGSIRSPLWVGGGVAFGPSPRSHRVKTNKKVRKLALKSALSDKAQAGKVFVIDSLALDAPKTKTMQNLLDNLDVKEGALFVIDKDEENADLSIRNLRDVDYVHFNTLNTYDVLNHDVLILSEAAADKVKEVYA